MRCPEKGPWPNQASCVVNTSNQLKSNARQPQVNVENAASGGVDINKVGGNTSSADDILSMVQEEHQEYGTQRNMPVTTGVLNRHAVSVLRDSGSNTVVLRRRLIPPESLTSKQRVIALVDGSTHILPEVSLHYHHHILLEKLWERAWTPQSTT